jgi:hypothetical protein
LWLWLVDEMIELQGEGIFRLRNVNTPKIKMIELVSGISATQFGDESELIQASSGSCVSF